MISPKKPSKKNIPSSKSIKLPQIHSRNRLQSANKKVLPSDILPKIPLNIHKRKLSINKQNNFHQNQLHQPGVQKKCSLQKNAIESRNQVEIAKNNIKNILKGLEQTAINLQTNNNETANFQYKIQLNRQLIKKSKHNVQINANKINQNQHEHEQKQIHKIKFISQKQISLVHENRDLQIEQDIEQSKDYLTKNKTEQIQVSHAPFINQKQTSIERQQKTQRKSLKKDSRPPKPNSNKNKIFKSIQQILQNPQKLCEVREIKSRNKIKFTIQQLQNQLKKLDKIQFNKSLPFNNKNEYQNEIGSSINLLESNDIKMKSAKSVGMIPIADCPLQQMYTVKNWNKVDFNLKAIYQQTDKQHQQIKLSSNSNKNIAYQQVKYHKGDFNTQMDHIQRLEMKSYKSIQKMVQNRKLLVDLKLLNSKPKNNVHHNEQLKKPQ